MAAHNAANLVALGGTGVYMQEFLPITTSTS